MDFDDAESSLVTSVFAFNPLFPAINMRIVFILVLVLIFLLFGWLVSAARVWGQLGLVLGLYGLGVLCVLWGLKKKAAEGASEEVAEEPFSQVGRGKP
jgi:hypothetical protein